MATGQRVDPYMSFRFLVEIDNIVRAFFSECTGFGSNIEVVEYREGGEPITVRKLPGKARRTFMPSSFNGPCSSSERVRSSASTPRNVSLAGAL